MQRAPRFVELDNDDRRWLESSIVEALGLAGRRPRVGYRPVDSDLPADLDVETVRGIN